MSCRITNEEFLSAVAMACKPGMFLWTCFAAGDPYKLSPSHWTGNKRAPDGGSVPNNLDLKPACDLNTYYSVSCYREYGGELRRKKVNFERMLALVVDDVDLSTLKAAPSYVLRTSPGKVQAGIFLSADDPDCQDVDLCSALVTLMIKRELVGDQSGNAVTRYVRLPVGQNQKPRETGHFRHELSEWRPEVRMSLSGAAAAVGIDLEAVRQSLAHISKQANGTEAGAYQAARDLGEVQGQSEKIGGLISNILNQNSLHDSINKLAASFAASGMAPGACVNTIRELMNNASGARDERWKGRYADISRSVSTAYQKYERPAEPPKAPVSAAVPEQKAKIFVDLDKLLDNLKPTSWVIQDFLECEALSVVYGPSNVGKSFITVDMACCVATGTPWHGKDVQKGVVVYVAGEGAQGIAVRLKAWSKHNGVNISTDFFKLTNAPVNLMDPDAAKNVVEAMEAELPKGVAPGLVVIDTLARSFIGGDENSAMDMGAFVNSVDTLIKARWKTHAVVVHHTGKDARKGSRGSGALKAAIDQEFTVEQAGVDLVSMTCSKMRNAQRPSEVTFKRHRILLERGLNNLGKMDDITSLVNELVEKPAASKGAPECSETRRTPEAIAQAMIVHGWMGTDWLAKYFGASKGTIYKMLGEAEAAGLIRQISNGGRKSYELTEKGQFLDALG